MKKQPTQEYVKSRLDYDPETGLFKWNNCFQRRFNGTVAGTKFTEKSGKSYTRISIRRKLIFAHQLAFLIMRGFIPDVIDHDDGNGENNKWTNLNESSNSHNSKNRRLYSSNNTGITGVHVQDSLFVVKINGERFMSTKDFFEACCKRKSLENEFGYSKNHGVSRPL